MSLTETTEYLRSADCPEVGTIAIDGQVIEYRRPRPLATALELIFGQRIYDVDTAPRVIIDGGSWLGVSILRFRTLFPGARIIGFEPDPEIFAVLQRNLRQNDATDGVTLVPAALAGVAGPRNFVATGSDSGSMHARVSGQRMTVDCVRASSYVTEPGTLLKLNIEGAECEVLEELGDQLSFVDQVLVEYHGFAELPQTLHRILSVLDGAGLTYIVSHFNERNRACVPPLRIMPGYRYFLLIYARRMTGPIPQGEPR
ncbi:FkbM family methyltransferase [Nocardia sp. NPDC059691]|uniref:FkbM family methyltransferase n=1 Tax=Nocardia sp. NPDC059691 TaxID=3346908 RepID=UPI00368C0E92